MSLKVVLSFRFLKGENPESTLSDFEKGPIYFRFYLSSDVAPRVKVEEVVIGDNNASYIVTLNTNDCNNELAAQDACVCIEMLCRFEIFNDGENGNKASFGYSRKSPIGESLIRLATFAKSRGKEIKVNINDNTPFREEFRVIRCSMGVTCTLMEMGPTVKLTGSENFEVDYERHKAMSLLEDEYGAFYQAHRPTKDGIQFMHVPTWRGNYIPIPACMWLLKRQYMPTDYVYSRRLLQRCLDITIELDEWNKVEFYKILDAQLSSKRLLPETIRCIKIITAAFCIVSNASDYVADLTEGKDTERFKNIRCGLYAGDCEDVSLEIYQEYMDLITDTFPGMSKNHKTLQTICLLYIPMIVTGTASTPSMDRSGDTSEELICHIYVSLRPRFDVLQRLTATIPRDIINGIRKQMLMEIPLFAFESELPIIVQEGTNMSCPLLNPFWSYTKDLKLGKHIEEFENRIVSIEKQHNKLKDLMVEIKQKPYAGQAKMGDDFNNFYKVVNNVWIDMTRYGLGIMDFSVGYLVDGIHVYGVEMYDWCQLDSNDDFVFVPVFVMTEEQLAIAIKTLEKNPPFTPIDVSDNMQTPTAIPQRIRQLVEKKAASYSNKAGMDYVSYRINRWEKITSAVISEIESCFSDRSYVALDARHYSITKDGELYIGELRLYFI